MQFYAYNGCFKEEQEIGTNFSVDIYLDVDTSLAEKTDEVSDTVDYSKVYMIVKREMQKPSHLLEHVGRRIISAVKEEFRSIGKVTLNIRKLNPPVGGQMDCVAITLED